MTGLLSYKVLLFLLFIYNQRIMEHLNDTPSLYSTRGDTAATIKVIG